MSTTSARPPRRTQEQRTAETRRKLLDAVVQSLIEEGYAATTTRRVAELAGVSQGAQTHHFPRRVDLVGAALEHVAEQRIDELDRLMASLPTSPAARTRAVLDLLWADFSSPLFTIFAKVWIAAADDRELYERLIPLERRMAHAITASIPSLVDDRAAAGDLSARVTTALSTLRGLALSHAFEPVARAPRDTWPEVRAVLERMLLAE